MNFEVTMPMLDEVMEEGTIISWSKKEGDPVLKGEELLLIETDKATMEIESPRTGVVAKLLAQAGEVVPCNQAIAQIEVEV